MPSVDSKACRNKFDAACVAEARYLRSHYFGATICIQSKSPLDQIVVARGNPIDRLPGGGLWPAGDGFERDRVVPIMNGENIIEVVWVTPPVD